MSEIAWQYCDDPNDINTAIETKDANWYGLDNADKIISVSYDIHQACYVVFWRIEE